MAKQKKRPILIGLAGGSGSGKTYLARSIQEGAGAEHVAVLSMDQYFRTEDLEVADASHTNFDHPAHIDFRLLIKHIRGLKNGQIVQTPAYDFHSMKQTPNAIRIEPKPIILVEGLFILTQPVVDLFDLTCFLDVESDQRLLGRILRDLEERGAKIEQIIDRYQRFVRPSYDVFVAPTKQNAHVVVDFTYRRAFFTELLTHVVRDYVKGYLDMEKFLEHIGKETYHMGYRPESGSMPMTTDIFKLSRAFPASAQPRGLPADTPKKPRLFLGRNHNHDEHAAD